MPKSVPKKRNRTNPYHHEGAAPIVGIRGKIALAFAVGAIFGLQFCGSPSVPMQPMGANPDSKSSTATIATKTSNPAPAPNNVHKVNIQVAVTTSTNGLEYAMRLWVSALNGWHQDFAPDVPIYTFDEIVPQSPVARLLVTPLKPMFEGEPTKRNNNLLLAALQEAYKLNPNADWYLLAEDDSIIVRENLEHAIISMKLDPKEEFIAGKCAGTPGATNRAGTDVAFCVGGSGILLSHALTKAMAPHLPHCREKFKQLSWGDERIGACLKIVMNRTMDYCAMSNQFPFISYDIVEATQKFAPSPDYQNKRLVALHEKNPKRIQLLNDWIRARTGEQITFKGFQDDAQLMAALAELPA